MAAILMSGPLRFWERLGKEIRAGECLVASTGDDEELENGFSVRSNMGGSEPA